MICGFVKFFNEEENLDRCLSNLKQFCDYIVCCDDSSTDNSVEIAKKYTNDIITLENEFKDELIHKQRLLEYALEKYPDITHFVHLDPDETINNPEKIKELCKQDVDGFYVHLKNLWMSEEKYRVDNNFNTLWKIPIWKNNGKLKFPEVKGLHMPQNPQGLEKVLHTADVEIIHYGFSSRKFIQRKFETYARNGQTGTSLERIDPDRKAKLMDNKKHIKINFIEKIGNIPFISIGIPVYNTDVEMFKKSINSVINQDYKSRIEIIVVDDGSKDEFSREYKAICEIFNAKYIKQENKGIAGARNRIIEETETDYLGFISSDDELATNFVSEMWNTSRDKIGFFFSDFYVIDENNNIKGECKISKINHEDMVIMAIQAAKASRMFICYNIFSDTQTWKNNMFWEDKRYGEDLSHLLECMLINKIEFHHIDKPLFFYRESSQMTTQKVGMEKIKENNKDTFQKINKLMGKKIF